MNIKFVMNGDFHQGYSPSPSGDYFLVNNPTHYSHQGCAGWEHDNSGDEHNFSGCEDEMLSAEAEHKGWSTGYDF